MRKGQGAARVTVALAPLLFEPYCGRRLEIFSWSIALDM